MAPAKVKQALGDLDRDSYVALLTKLIGETEHLQNNPPDLVPEEDRIVNHVLDVLSPLSTNSGGPLVIEHVTYETKRGNLIVEYPGTQPGKIVSFVGMHMDVVTADASTWEFYPFSLSIEGDELRGRGTTDCLGHVAMVAELMKKLAEAKPALKYTVVAVFIVNEENSSKTGIGVEKLKEDGYLDKLKPGPLYWVDTSDKQPCIGTAGVIPWTFHTTGHLFHSGLPNKAINPLELSMEALKLIQTRFYEEFPPHPKEQTYNFATPSTMKPTQWSYPGGGINQIPGECTIAGDVRLTPFYSVDDVIKKLHDYEEYLNTNIESIPTRGPVSKYVLPDQHLRGKIKLDFGTAYPGIACNLEGTAYRVLSQATKEVIGDLKPFSLTGSLPLVGDLQEEGYDVMNIGYGLEDVYHADNEYCLFSDMSQGYAVFARIISLLEEGAA